MALFGAALTVGSLVWIAVLLIAPAAAAHGHHSALVLLTYQAAGLLCHQIPERSFHISGVPLPVCARCFGLYAAAAFGALIAWTGSGIVRDVRARTARLLLGVAALPTAVTFAGEWLQIVHPSSLARAVAALPLGIAAGWLVVRLTRVDWDIMPGDGE